MNVAFRNLGELIADLSKSSSPDEASRHQFEPTKVQIVSGTGDILSMVRTGMAPVLAPAASFAVVIVLVVFIVPFTVEGDELVGLVLTRLLEVEGVTAGVISWRALRSQKVEKLREMRPQWILLSAIEARSALAVGKMARSIKMVLPEAVILIGLWSLPPQGGARVIRKITESSVGAIYTSMEQAVRGIASLVSTASEETHSDLVDNSRSM
jgi:hypothetical protein